MYNGIGLTTPRGSGTNGYVQRNLSFVRKTKEKIKEQSNEDTAVRAYDPALVEHERRRQIEVRCLELRELLEEQEVPEEEIEDEVATFRAKLLEEKKDTIVRDSSGRPMVKDSHELAMAQESKNERAKHAFGIRDDFVPGSSLDSNRLPEKLAALEKVIAPAVNEKPDIEIIGGVENRKKEKKEKKKRRARSASSSSSSSSSSSDSDSSSTTSSSSSSDSSSGDSGSEDGEISKRRSRKRKKVQKSSKSKSRRDRGKNGKSKQRSPSRSRSRSVSRSRSRSVSRSRSKSRSRSRSSSHSRSRSISTSRSRSRSRDRKVRKDKKKKDHKRKRHHERSRRR